MCKIKLNFIFKKTGWGFKSPIKSYGQFSKRVWKGHFLCHFFKGLLWILSITLFWRLKVTKVFVGMRFSLISQFFLVQSLKKSYSTIIICSKSAHLLQTTPMSSCFLLIWGCLSVLRDIFPRAIVLRCARIIFDQCR